MNNKIIVTGAGGQLGSEIKAASHLLSDYEFIFLTRSELAIEDAEAVNSFFEKHQPSFCINCAAYTAVDKAETDTDAAFLINGQAVGNLADACKTVNARFIHISTDYVFNGKGAQPYLEDQSVDPVNRYGASKLKGEQLALSHGSSVVIRTSWVYSEFGNNFVKTMMRLMSERDTLNVVDDQLGSPTYAADLAVTILGIIGSEKWVPGVYHYSNEGVITWYEFALAIKELTGKSCHVYPVPSSQYPTPAIRPAYSVLSKEKIKATYQVALKEWKKSLEVCIAKLT